MGPGCPLVSPPMGQQLRTPLTILNDCRLLKLCLCFEDISFVTYNLFQAECLVCDSILNDTVELCCGFCVTVHV